MRFQSGITDQYIYFMAVDSTDLKTAETGLTSFTVYRSRNGGAATAYTTPTVAEVSAANMPGVYSLLLDEDMTIDAGDDSQAVVLRITQASMAPVTLMYELYRPIVTAGSTITVANGCADADIERLQGNAIATPSVSGVLEVDVTHFNGTAGTFSSGRPEVNTSHIAGSAVSTSSAQIGVNVVNAAGTAWNSGAIGAATLATDTITAAKIAADAIGASELAADAIAEIADAVWDEDATGHQTTGTFGQAIGDPGASTETLYKAIVTDPAGTNIAADVIALKAETASIQTDTNDIQARLPAALTADGNIKADTLRIGGTLQTANDVGADVDAILVDTAEIGAAGAGLTALPWNAAWDAEVQSEVEDALVVHRLDELLNADSDIDGAAPPTVGSVFHELMTKTTGSFTYDQTTDSLEAVRDRGDAAWITATGFSTHSAADVWAVGTRVLTAATNISGPIADQVWEEAIADHSGTAGSTAEALAAAGSAGDPWSTALPGAYGAGTAGKIVGDNLNATVSSRLASASYTAPLDAAGTRSAVGLASANLDTQLGTIDNNIDEILLDTAEIGVAGAGLTNINLPDQTMNITGNLSGSVGSVISAVAITSNRKKGATATFEFTMTDSTTGADQTGLTVSAVISKDGGAFAATSNAVTETAGGWYQIVLTASEMTANNIALQFTAASATTRDMFVQTQP